VNEPRECPGCRVELPVTDWPGGSPKANASPECQQVAGELLGFEVENAARLGICTNSGLTHTARSTLVSTLPRSARSSR
jgi:hypothetical protein